MQVLLSSSGTLRQELCLFCQGHKMVAEVPSATSPQGCHSAGKVGQGLPRSLSASAASLISLPSESGVG